jgi:serine/threonine protein phosphatase 1
MRTLAIGDIHGCSLHLDALLAAVAPTPADTLVFLGDYVDRGPDSRGVLDRLIALRTTQNAVFLRGNHELMMTRSRTDRDELKMWKNVGGAQTLASYSPVPGRVGTLENVPPGHWAFLDDHLLNWYETDTHVFVHAGLDPSLPVDEQGEEWLFWQSLNPSRPPARHVSGKTVVVGHTAQPSGLVLDLGTVVGIDTHAYGGGKLTCLDAETGRFWQADLLGRVTTGML